MAALELNIEFKPYKIYGKEYKASKVEEIVIIKILNSLKDENSFYSRLNHQYNTPLHFMTIGVNICTNDEIKKITNSKKITVEGLQLLSKKFMLINVLFNFTF